MLSGGCVACGFDPREVGLTPLWAITVLAFAIFVAASAAVAVAAMDSHKGSAATGDKLHDTLPD